MTQSWPTTTWGHRRVQAIALKTKRAGRATLRRRALGKDRMSAFGVVSAVRRMVQRMVPRRPRAGKVSTQKMALEKERILRMMQRRSLRMSRAGSLSKRDKVLGVYSMPVL